ncbi:hypothetical protein [Couchioplanes azureus]|uniref:hypothetical protein n=1 Tax=Couchioplanes caeruleus TaxID=56438 RepID=UPI001670B89E|nr:hypothetical protein [Couchioplanes caeruleus]GGQ42984.1 hypothetical protein GCM10010166_09010 [Couchioplanes caeruleus subsp. azureus]
MPGDQQGPRRLRAGDMVHVSRAASVQFAIGFNFRVIRVDDKPTYEGWCWLDGYQMDGDGMAIERRKIFVQVAGLRPARQ